MELLRAIQPGRLAFIPCQLYPNLVKGSKANNANYADGELQIANCNPPDHRPFLGLADFAIDFTMQDFADA